MAQLLDSGILIKGRNNTVRLSWTVPGTVANLICQLASENLYSFREIMSLLPRSARVSSSKLKNLIAYLCNVKKIQFITDPITSLTIVVPEDSEIIEKWLDTYFVLSDYMEPRFLYRPESDELEKFQVGRRSLETE